MESAVLAARRELWDTDEGLLSWDGSGGDDGNYGEAFQRLSEQVTSEVSLQERR